MICQDDESSSLIGCCLAVEIQLCTILSHIAVSCKPVTSKFLSDHLFILTAAFHAFAWQPQNQLWALFNPKPYCSCSLDVLQSRPPCMVDKVCWLQLKSCSCPQRETGGGTSYVFIKDISSVFH